MQATFPVTLGGECLSEKWFPRSSKQPVIEINKQLQKIDINVIAEPHPGGRAV